LKKNLTQISHIFKLKSTLLSDKNKQK